MKSMTKTFLTAFAAGLLLAPGAFAQDLEASLQQLAAADGAAYVQARDALLVQPNLAEQLDGRAAEWSDASWQRDTIADALELRLKNPQLISKLNNLQGMDPGHYMLRRKKGPGVLNELKWLKAEAGPALAELLLKTQDLYPHIDFPPGEMDDAGRELWRAAEKQALTEGLCVVLGWTKHASAPFVLEDIMKDAGRADMTRFAAATGLGETMNPAVFGTLEGVLLDDAQTMNLRGGCMAAISKLPSQEALDALIAFSAADQAEGLRRPAVAGLGTFGSSWGWRSRGQERQGEAFRQQIVPVLVNVLAEQGDQEAIATLATQAIASVQHDAALPLLTALAADGERTDAVRAAATKAKQVLEVGLRRARR